jgi:hypothetical protein
VWNSIYSMLWNEQGTGRKKELGKMIGKMRSELIL